ncbi:MAG: hypothetical protein ACU85U_16945 [Gammaproteobacteria bacterium]
MCAHKVIGMSLIGLTCSAVVASSLVQVNPGTKVISAKAGDASVSCCGINIAASFEPRSPAEEVKFHELIVGSWVGETEIEGIGRRRFLAEHFEDGTFRVTFRTIEPDGRKCIDQYVGNWGVSGPIYFTILTGTLRGRDIDATDRGSIGRNNAYAILDVDDALFEYESFSSRSKFLAWRVGENFGPNDL